MSSFNKAFTTLTLLAFQLIKDADKSTPENEDTIKAFEARVKDLTDKFDVAGLKYEKIHMDFRDCNILELRIALLGEGDEFLAPNKLNLLTELDQLKPNIGQTLVFWTELDENSSTARPDLARKFLGYLYQGKSPHLSEGKLFGGNIYEYQGFSEDEPFRHIWFWFVSDIRTYGLLQKRLHELKKLLCFRNKIFKSFQQAQAYSKNADSLYLDIKGLSQEVIQRIDLPDGNRSKITPLKNRLGELDSLKKSLKNISIGGFELSEEIRYLRYSYSTIETNSINYQTELGLIKKDALSEDSLHFLQEFYIQSQKQFLKQISGDLSYIIPSYDLTNQTIAVIRGYIEIEQAKCEQDLKDTIEAISIALGSTAIIASYSGQLEKPWRWPWSRDHSNYPHPFVTYVFLSLLLAWIFYQITFWFKRRR